MPFKVGDKAVHNNHGVGDVEAIEVREIAGIRKDFYIVKIRGQNSEMTVMVPTEAAERLLRPIIGKTKAEKVYEELRKEEVTVDVGQPWNKRERQYNELLNSGSPIKIARVVRDLHRLKHRKELSTSERDLLKDARQRLVPELALARRVKDETIEKDIETLYAAPPAE